MEKLVIDRGSWLTGTAGKTLEDSRLRHSKTGLECCVGVYGEACGLDMDYLNKRITVDSLTATYGHPEMAWLYSLLDAKDRKKYKTERIVQDALVEVNDGKLHPIRKEAALTKLFKKYGGIDLTFTGHYAEATQKARNASKN